MPREEFRPDTRKAFARIKKINRQHDFVLFFDREDEIPPHDAGTKLIELFKKLGIPLHTFDITQDDEIWNNIKYYHNFVYNDQLHVKGEYVFRPVEVLEAYEEGTLGNWLEFFAGIKLKQS